MKELWIIAEQKENEVAESYFELLSKAKQVYKDTKFTPLFVAIVLGKNKQIYETLLSSGVDKVIGLEHEKLNQYNPVYTIRAIADLARERKPEIILTAASNYGAEVAPGVAARLNTGLVAHCTELYVDEEGTFHMMIPAFGGKLLGDDIIPESRPIMASVKPGVFNVEAVSETNAELENIYVTGLDTLEAGINLERTDEIQTKSQSVDKAEIVLCVGHGAAAEECIDKVKELGEKLGASVGYTRPMVDLGYFPNENDMIGTSGKTVKPQLYVGFGISGASHHICGMKDSGVIVNINNDSEADCFNYSDYKIVGDCNSILDEMVKI